MVMLGKTMQLHAPLAALLGKDPKGRVGRQWPPFLPIPVGLITGDSFPATAGREGLAGETK